MLDNASPQHTPKPNGAPTEPFADAHLDPANGSPPPSPTPSSSPRLSLSTVANMWSGLMRTFSTDSASFPTQTTNPSSTTSSMFEIPPLDPVALRGYKESTAPGDRLLSSALAEEIRALIPERMKLVDDWKLIFSLSQDGASLGTMYSRAREYRGTRAGFVMVVRDSSGGVSFPPSSTVQSCERTSARERRDMS